MDLGVVVILWSPESEESKIGISYQTEVTKKKFRNSSKPKNLVDIFKFFDENNHFWVK